MEFSAWCGLDLAYDVYCLVWVLERGLGFLINIAISFVDSISLFGFGLGWVLILVFGFKLIRFDLHLI